MAHGSPSSPSPTPVAPPTPAAAPIPDVLPVLPLRETVVFPRTTVPLVVGQERSLRLVDDAMRAGRMLALVAQRAPQVEDAGPDDLYRTGTVAAIRQLLRAPDGTLRVAVQGLERIRLLDFTATEPYLQARLLVLPEGTGGTSAGLEVESRRRALLDLFRKLAGLIESFPGELVPAAEALQDPRELAYLVASVVPLPPANRQEVLELDPVDAKLRRLVELLQHEVAVRELGRQIATETQERLSKTQREHLLREQLRSIQTALGEGEENPELVDLRRRIGEARLPEEARKEAERELDRLQTIPQASPEYGLIRTYLDWMASLPWNTLTGGEIDVQRARRVLDEDHYDLDTVKDRLIEYLAVRKLRRQRQGAVEQVGLAGDGVADHAPHAGPMPMTRADEAGREPILCLVGPPGVGKTSLGQSIARALGRTRSSACHWAACVTRRRSAATAAPTSGPCPAASSRPSGARRRATR